MNLSLREPASKYIRFSRAEHTKPLSWFTQLAIKSYTTLLFVLVSRVPIREPYERLEPYEGKLSCTVLRGGAGSNAIPLPDQLIENKQKFIGQIMTSKSPARSCDDMDEAALSYAEVKALAVGNPLIKEKMDLDIQLTRLKTLKAAHDSQRYELENKIAIGFPAEIRKCKEQIENATVDAATVTEHSAVDADGKDVFCMQLEKEVYYEKEPAGKALLGLLGLAINSEKPVPIGYYKGMELQIQHTSLGNEYYARLVGSGTYSALLGADVLGNLTRLSNLANGIEPSIEKTHNLQIQLEQQLARAKEEVAKPFQQEAELAEKSQRQVVLEGLLKMKDKVPDTMPEQQCQTDNRQRGQEER